VSEQVEGKKKRKKKKKGKKKKPCWPARVLIKTPNIKTRAAHMQHLGGGAQATALR
jgi:hypothetical protein